MGRDYQTVDVVTATLTLCCPVGDVMAPNDDVTLACCKVTSTSCAVFGNIRPVAVNMLNFIPVIQRRTPSKHTNLPAITLLSSLAFQFILPTPNGWKAG